MSEVILVVLRRPETAMTLLDAGSRLAAWMGEVRIQVLALREPIEVHALAAEELMTETDTVLEAKGREGERLRALKRAFDQWAADGSEVARSARWIEAEGSAHVLVGKIGSRSDVIVAGQPADEDRPARQAFRAALFGTDRPVLMVPPGPIARLGQVVAVAWRDEKRAMRAVIPALRSLRTAEQVHVLVGVRDGTEAPVIPRVLVEHGVRAELHVLRIGSGPFGQTLLDKVRQLSADLLVMGAYAHSPLRELILGGVTRYMLTHADLPVFMRH